MNMIPPMLQRFDKEKFKRQDVKVTTPKNFLTFCIGNGDNDDFFHMYLSSPKVYPPSGIKCVNQYVYGSDGNPDTMLGSAMWYSDYMDKDFDGTDIEKIKKNRKILFTGATNSDKTGALYKDYGNYDYGTFFNIKDGKGFKSNDAYLLNTTKGDVTLSTIYQSYDGDYLSKTWLYENNKLINNSITTEIYKVDEPVVIKWRSPNVLPLQTYSFPKKMRSYIKSIRKGTIFAYIFDGGKGNARKYIPVVAETEYIRKNLATKTTTTNLSIQTLYNYKSHIYKTPAGSGSGSPAKSPKRFWIFPDNVYGSSLFKTGIDLSLGGNYTGNNVLEFFYKQGEIIKSGMYTAIESKGEIETLLPTYIGSEAQINFICGMSYQVPYKNQTTASFSNGSASVSYNGLTIIITPEIKQGTDGLWYISLHIIQTTSQNGYKGNIFELGFNLNIEANKNYKD